MAAVSSLHALLEERCDNRVLRIFGEHVKTQSNFHSQLEEIDHKEVVIQGQRLLNFNAINYLGLEFHPRMIEAAQEAIGRWGTLAGSARAAAEVNAFEELESRLANFLGVDNVILFTTVTLANHGVIPLLMRKRSLILLDWEAHCSVQQAATEAKGAGAGLLTFKHDEFGELEDLLKANRDEYKHIMIALDGVYSMLGTYLDLPRYQALAEEYGALLFIDDAHGFGCIGPGGRGIVSHYGGDYDNIVYVGSLEKSLASLGGFVVLPAFARDLVRFTSSTYIFSGQLPPPYLFSGIAALDILENDGQRLIDRLNESTRYVKQQLLEMGFELVAEEQPSPLILVKVGDVYAAPQVSQFFFEEGIHILTTGFPIIPIDRGAMVRISMSAAHTDAQIERLLDAFRKLRDVPYCKTRAPGAGRCPM